MTLLFVNTDGVLNTLGNSYTTYGDAEKKQVISMSSKLEYHLLERLEFIMSKIEDVAIIFTTPWDKQDILFELNTMRFAYMKKIIDYLPRDNKHLGLNINMMLRKHKPVKFIIIDDELSNVTNHIHSKHTYRVDKREGLLDRDVHNILKKLGNSVDYTPKSEIKGYYTLKEMFNALVYKVKIENVIISKTELRLEGKAAKFSQLLLQFDSNLGAYMNDDYSVITDPINFEKEMEVLRKDIQRKVEIPVVPEFRLIDYKMDNADMY